jgi:hypothetical protein
MRVDMVVRESRPEGQGQRTKGTVEKLGVSR